MAAERPVCAAACCSRCALLLLVFISAAAAISDEGLTGRWRATGLHSSNSSALDAQVCLVFGAAGPVTEQWFMQSWIDQAQQKVLGTKTIEVKYKIDAALTLNNVSEGSGSVGSFTMKATNVYGINVYPVKFTDSMTAERKKFVGRHRSCVYMYADESKLRMTLACSNQKPTNGFYRYGDKKDFPNDFDGAVTLQKGQCNRGTLPAGWPTTAAGYRVRITFAGSIKDFSSARKAALIADLSNRLKIDKSSIMIVSATAGSFIVNILIKSDKRDTALESRLGALAKSLSEASGQSLGGMTVISMSFKYYEPKAEAATPDTGWTLMALPLWAIATLYVLGTAAYGACAYVYCTYPAK